MKQVARRSVVLCAIALISATASVAQTPGTKTPLTFNGKVVTVNDTAKSLKVDGEKVEGWMAAMTMEYKVDDPEVLKKLKPGDRIMATVYQGDMVLHKVRVMPMSGDMKQMK
jgi:Cu/Ag efflux protein CusF